MAENPLRYSDLLQPDNSIEQAIAQLEKLNSTYAQTLQTVKNEAIRMQASVENMSGATEQHRNKIRETTAQVDRLTKAQKDLEFAMSDTAKEIAALKEQQREAQNIAKLTAKLNASEAGSYNALSAQYSLNKIQLNKLSQEYRENTKAGQQLVKETEEIYARMKQLQEATGKFTLNVGNYKSAWDGLGVSAQQLVRELPSLAVSANTFFSAISNNIPMLVDEINKLKAANAAAAAAGEATVPIWRSVARAFLSWNTVISLGITLLTVFGGDIIKWVQDLVTGEKQLDHMKDAMQGVNDAMQNGRKDAQQSIVRLNLLYNATQDVTRSTEERKKAVAELKKEFPTYFQNLTDEKILAGEAADSYNRLAKSITATAMARAAEEQMIENSKQILDLETEINNAYQEQEKAQEKLRKAEASIPDVVTGGEAGAELMRHSLDAVRDAQNEVDRWGDAADTARAKLYALNKANTELARRINIEDLTATPGQQEPATTTKTPRDRTQTITTKNINITESLYRSNTDLIADDLQRQRQLFIDTYEAERADLMNKYNNDKDLTEQSRENINQIILNKQKKLQQDLAALDAQQQQRDLETEQASIQLRLDAVEQGTAEENSLRIQLLENARKQELLANSQLIESQKQDEAAINAKYDRQILQQDQRFQTERAMLLFDQQQALNQSEFDLLKTTEEEKTRFKLEAEKARLQKILQLAQAGGQQLSDIEIKTIQNTIKKIDQEIEQVSRGGNKDIYDLVGLKLDDDEKQAISESVGFSIQQLQSILDAQVQIKEQALQNAQEEVDAAQSRLDAEIEARNNGYANDVATAKKELELAKQKEEKALKEKQKAQKQQQALDTLTQTSSLITASANIWSSLSGIPIVGYALAIAAIASMWASFAAAKIKARQVTAVSQEYGEGGLEFLEGGSHASGNDIDLGIKNKKKKRMKAEGGEALAIINKRNTRRYRKVLPNIIDSLNKGTFENKYLNAFANADELNVSFNTNNTNIDLSKIEGDVQHIRKQNETKYYALPNGMIIMQRKNVKRIIKN